MSKDLDFRADWHQICDEKQLEKDLATEDGLFKFKGCGWYLTQQDTVLIVPANPYSVEEEKKYHVFVWNRPSIGAATEGSPFAIFEFLSQTMEIKQDDFE